MIALLIRYWHGFGLLILFSLAAAPAGAGLFDLADSNLSAEHWIAQAPDVDRVRLDARAIQALNAALAREDASVFDLAGSAGIWSGDDVRRLIGKLSVPLASQGFDRRGRPIAQRQWRVWQRALNLRHIPETVQPQTGLVVARADLRRYPTPQAVLKQPVDTDIDRFQESALFPGDPVLLLHASRDRRWWFVLSRRYAAWIGSENVAIGEPDAVFGFEQSTPRVIVLGRDAHTAFAPDAPEVSRIRLDMGVSLPWLRDWPSITGIHGQSPLASWVVQLPVRAPDGRLQLRPVLVPRSELMAGEPLAFTSRNLLTQSFRFLGERYGWGHDFQGRDCSGFVAEVYRSMGIDLPRNTGDQAQSPVYDRLPLPADMSAAARARALAEAAVGDLLYMPGHVMMVIGQVGAETYVIHDVHAVSLANADGGLSRWRLNGVHVTPLSPLRTESGAPFIEQLTAIQRIRPKP